MCIFKAKRNSQFPPAPIQPNKVSRKTIRASPGSQMASYTKYKQEYKSVVKPNQKKTVHSTLPLAVFPSRPFPFPATKNKHNFYMRDKVFIHFFPNKKKTLLIITKQRRYIVDNVQEKNQYRKKAHFLSLASFVQPFFRFLPFF